MNPRDSLRDKTILLGITGSIAAYRAPEIIRILQDAGANVFPILTRGGSSFITALTLKTIARNPVATDLWTEDRDWAPGHIELADRADLLVVAPATAHCIAQFAHGLAPDLLTSIHLATPAPVLIAPAMNGKMWTHPATQANCTLLKERGYHFVEPDTGMLACGYAGVGKLASPEKIADQAAQILE